MSEITKLPYYEQQPSERAKAFAEAYDALSTSHIPDADLLCPNCVERALGVSDRTIQSFDTQCEHDQTKAFCSAPHETQQAKCEHECACCLDCDWWPE